MSFFPSKKKLIAERDRLQAEINIITTRNTERVIAGEKLSVDEMMKPLLPLTGKAIEIETKIIALSSKRELVSERNTLQSQLDLLSQVSLSEEERLGVRVINSRIEKLDYSIKSKYGFGNSIVRWLKYIQLAFVVAISLGAIISVIYQLFK